MKSSVMFLLGSGSSIPGHFPSTSDITSQVFSGNNIIRHTDSRYYFFDNPSELQNIETKEYLSDVLLLIRSIREIMQLYDKEEPLNYEILYYFVQQLHDYESGDLLNMALYPFVKDIKNKMPENARFIDISREAENYIRQTVWGMLNKVSTNIHTHLNFLSDALTDNDMSVVNITTLNHDLLIEKHLNDNKINYCDGFDVPINDVRYWKNVFSKRNNLLKVHGSINWFPLHPDGGDWFDDQIGIVLNGDIDHAKSPSGGLMMSVPEKEPHILVGTFNKIYEYTEGIFSDIYHQFRKLLGKSKNLVISGYGFGDKGINTAIIEWLYTDRKNKIIVIHPDMKELLENRARLAIVRSYNGFAKTNFINIPKYIQETTWKEIKAKI